MRLWLVHRASCGNTFDAMVMQVGNRNLKALSETNVMTKAIAVLLSKAYAANRSTKGSCLILRSDAELLVKPAKNVVLLKKQSNDHLSVKKIL
jgi:hypothetical protein